MKYFFTVFCILTCPFMLSCNKIIMEDTAYEGRPHFKISTKSATYFFDVAGGGLSRMIDKDGVDWIHYNGDPHANVPFGASGGYRGIPNSVYKSEDGGASHPGFDKCVSKIISENSIKSWSLSGKWEWLWEFFNDYARLTVLKADPDHPYWFLYEGVVGGTFHPYQKYWGTDLGGPRYEVPSLNHRESIIEQWQWTYFGDKEMDRIFYVAQYPKDTLNDHFSYMGNTREGKDAPDGMIVFGFGRDKGPKALMKDTGITFFMGFLEKKISSEIDHIWAGKQIEKNLKK